MKKIFSLLIMNVLILSSCSGVNKNLVTETNTGAIENVPVKYVSTKIVEKKPFAEELKLSGKVISSKETIISPQATGVIKEILVGEGDKVKKGDTLATIDTQTNLSNITLDTAQNSYNNTVSVYNFTKEALQKDIETARLQLENAKTTKENTYKTTQKQLELAQAQLDTVLTQKGNTSKTVESTLSLAQKSLENAQLSLINFDKNAIETKKSLDIKKQTLVDKKDGLIDTLRTTIDSTLVSIDTSLTNIDKLLGITDANKTYNDNFEIFLSAKDSQAKTDAAEIFRDINGTYQNIKSLYNPNLSEEDTLLLYSDILKMTDKMLSLFDKMTSVLDNTVISGTLTEATVNGYKASNLSSQGGMLGTKSTLVSINNSLKDINNSITDIENSISSTQTSLSTQRASLEQAVSIAQSTLDNTKVNTTTSLDSIGSTENTTKIQLENTIESIKSARELADNSLKIAENQYISAKAKLDSQLASTKTQLDSISGQKNQASQQIANSIIKAPYDGIISEKAIEIGSMVNQGTKAFSISNATEKKIVIEVNSENVKHLQKGQMVFIQKNDKTATGSIVNIGISADINTKMFQVEITFKNKELNDYLVLGDFVDITINKNATKEGYIIIPFSSLIVGSNGDHSVYIVGSGNLVESKKVKIGASNSSEIIILEGINEKDRIITSGTLNVSLGDKVEEIQ